MLIEPASLDTPPIAVPKLSIALCAALLLHGIFILAILTSRISSDELPPGAGIGLEKGELGGDGETQEQDAAEAEQSPLDAKVPPSPDVALATAALQFVKQMPPVQSHRMRSAFGGGHSYFGLVRAHLNSYKRELPADLIARGVVEVRFSVAADGRASAIQLSGTSGTAALDAEALSLVQRASPLPAPPEGKAMWLVVPIEFR